MSGSFSWARPSDSFLAFSHFNRSATTKCWYLSGFLMQRSDLGPLVFGGSHASTKALQRFSADRASGAVSAAPPTSPRRGAVNGSHARQHQLGHVDGRILPNASFSSQFSIHEFPVSARSHLVCGLGSATISHGSTGMLAKCWVRSR